MLKNKKIDEISFDGGLLSLNYVNSVPNRTAKKQPDYLLDIFDLIAWAKRIEVIDASAERNLILEAKRQPKKAKVFFNEAVEFRELLHSIFWHISSNKKIPDLLMAEYNIIIKKYFPFLKIKIVPNGFEEEWHLEEMNFKKILAPILNDSYETLLSEKLIRIKECGNCGWLFYDTTKNGKRRWCSMKSCGSNLKALEWYHRNK